MAGAFQSNAFQNDAFQVDSAFTGGSGQAQCDIKQTYYGFGQANAQILATQHRLNAKYFDFTLRGQIWDHFWQDTEEIITTIGYGSGQAQADIKQIYYGLGQAQCDVKQIYYGFGQAQCDVKTQGYGLGQAQCDIKTQGFGLGQSQCAIKRTEYGLGQAQCDTKVVGYGLGQVNASILGAVQQFGQSQCDIKAVISSCGQAQCDVKQTQYGHGQTQCQVLTGHFGYGQAQCYIPSDMTCLTDEFDRVVGTGWGTGNIGAWTSLGSNGDDSVDGTYGLDDWFDFGVADLFGSQITHYTDVPAPAIGQDVWEEQIDFYWADASGGTPNIREMALEWTTSTDFEQSIGVEFDALNSTIDAFWFSDVDNADDIQTITVDLSALGHLKIRYDSISQTISATYWENSDPEPAPQSSSGGVASDLGATPLIVVGHNSLQTAPSGLTTSTPFKVDTLQFCYGGAVGITAGYGQAQALICAVIVRDTFSRVSLGNPGTPDIGPDWGNELFSEYSLLTTNGSELILTGNSDYDFFDGTIGNNLLNGEVSIDFNLDVVRNWATIFDIITRVQAEGVFSQPSIQAYSYYDPDENKFFLYIQSSPPIINVNIEIDPIDAGEWYRAKVGLSGDTISVKVWKISDPEPDWLLQATGAYIEPGIVEFFADVGEAGSYPAIVLFDNVYICSTETIFTHHKSAQAQAFIRIGIQKCGQAQADIKAVRRGFGQAQCKIILTQGYGQANAKLIGYPTKFAQANALILKWAGYGQAMADIQVTFRGYGQAQCLVNRSYATGQAMALIDTHQRWAQAQCLVVKRSRRVAQAQCYIVKYRQYQSAQTICLVNSLIKQSYGQAQAYIYNLTFGQAQARIQKLVIKSAQAQAYILTGWSWAQAQATIHVSGSGTGYAQCLVNLRLGTGQARCFIGSWGWAQAEAYITRPQGYALAMVEIADHNSGQAQCYIASTLYIGGQAQCYVFKFKEFGQAQAYIKNVATKSYGQAQAMIRSKTALAQAQCRIVLINTIATGQARVVVNNNTHTGQAQTLIFGSAFSPTYQINYNGRILPGYVNSESYDSVMNVYQANPTYMDLKFAEYTGLQNKVISLQFKAWSNNSFVDSKEATQLAGTIIRSNRSGFVPLYIQSMDKHYLALAKKLTTDNSIKSTHSYDYQVEFECKPWLITDATNTISGTGLIDTGVRTLDNGGWTPARISITGTDVTVSGYTATGDFTGFISVSGGVSGLEINSESYTALIAGINRNDVMNNLDYALYVGPGQTFFEVDGGTVTIEWEDRHLL